MQVAPVDWSAVVERLVAEGRIDANTPVDLYLSAAGDLHGRDDCPAVLRPASPVPVPLRAAAQTPSRMCECGGWLSSDIGSRVAAAEACFSAERRRDAGTVPASWAEVLTLLTDHRGSRLASLSSGDPDRIEFSDRAIAANLEIAERARGVLDPSVIDRAIAAQALVVPVTADQASGFANWARSLRIERLHTYESFRQIVPYLESELTRCLEPVEQVLVGLQFVDQWAARFGPQPLPWGLPAEVTLLLWFHRALGRSQVALHLHPAVAAGLNSLAIPKIPASWRIAAAASAEPDPVVADLAVLLWAEASDPDLTLDLTLDVARNIG
jgi:hypothetical protein